MHSKEVLAEFIYKLNEKTNFLLQGTTWSYPCVGFLYNHSLPSSFMWDLENKKILKEDIKSVICVLGDWQNVAEGIVFTDQAIYVTSPKNKEDKKFRLSYNNIKKRLIIQIRNWILLQIGEHILLIRPYGTSAIYMILVLVRKCVGNLFESVLWVI